MTTSCCMMFSCSCVLMDLLIICRSLQNQTFQQDHDLMRGVENQSKREAKKSKVIQKELEELHRESEAMNRGHEERQTPDSDDGTGLADRKSKRWWTRFDERHFKRVSARDVQQLRDITTSERVFEQSPKEPLPPITFAHHKIITHYDLLAEDNLLHVLFKTRDPRQRYLASYELQRGEFQVPPEKEDEQERHSFKVTPCIEGEKDKEESHQIKMTLAGYNQEEELCRAVDHYKRSMAKHADKSDVERQLYFWEKELFGVNKDNQLVWDRLAKAIRKTAQANDIEPEIRNIRNFLMWVTVLKYFEHGFTDKTSEQLQLLIDGQRLLKPAKSKGSNAKYLFQTDCKICFCSFNYDSNQVLYCDSCSTSFHLACYGLQELPKEEIYYCDSCRVQKRDNLKKIVCQLCSKSGFPIKQVQGHYYHVTCLILFNLVSIEEGTLTFRKGITHSKILQMVVDSELSQRACEFCAHQTGSDLGIRMRCSFAGCCSSAHPICAYINGCKFWMRRDDSQKLEISYHCNQHNQSRDWVGQIYLRRYMSNFKKTSEVKESVFREKYREEARQMEEGRLRFTGCDSQRILLKTKFIKRRLTQEEQKQVGGSEVQTETMKMLEKLKRKRQ